MAADDEDDLLDGGRGRSSIEWNYYDLKDTEDLVNALHQNAGTSCTPDQLAGFVRQAARGGGFRTRVNSAKAFGTLVNARGIITLTELGHRLVDPAQAPAARVEAFMNVELHKELFSKFKSTLLPPRPALTREIEKLGVIGTQAERARQVFERSADRAGFFAHGRDRLVMPALQTNAKSIERETASEEQYLAAATDEKTYDPLIQGLLNRLPDAGGEWPLEQRVTWLRALVTNLDLLYTNGGGSIAIEFKTQKGEGRDA